MGSPGTMVKTRLPSSIMQLSKLDAIRLTRSASDFRFSISAGLPTERKAKCALSSCRCTLAWTYILFDVAVLDTLQNLTIKKDESPRKFKPCVGMRQGSYSCANPSKLSSKCEIRHRCRWRWTLTERIQCNCYSRPGLNCDDLYLYCERKLQVSIRC
jgi:hypothetical protein